NDGSVGTSKLAQLPAARLRSPCGSLSSNDLEPVLFSGAAFNQDVLLVPAGGPPPCPPGLLFDGAFIQTPGVYAITGSIDWQANDSGDRMIALQDAASTLATSRTPPVTGGARTSQSVSTIARLDAGHVVGLEALQNTSPPTSLFVQDGSLAVAWI